VFRSHSRTSYFWLRSLAALLLASSLLWTARADEASDRAKQIADLEKQLVDLKTKLDDLKKSDTPKIKVLTVADVSKWRSFRGTAISNNGEWFAARIGASEGEGDIIVRSTKTDKEYKFPGGEGFGSLSFSFDNKWFAFSVGGPRPAFGGGPAPTPAPSGPTGPPRPATKAKVVLVELASGNKTEFEGIASVNFSGETATHIVLRKAPVEGSAAAGTDLLIRELSSGNELTLGNVASFAFDKKGRWLAMQIDAAGQIGNGIQIRDMQSGAIISLDSAKASYAGMGWTKEGEALVCTKEVELKPGEPKVNQILAFKPQNGKWDKIAYDPASDSSFPKNMVIVKGSANFTEALDAFLFSIQETPKVEPKKEPAKPDDSKKGEGKKDMPKKPDADEGLQQPKGTGPATTPASDKPDLVIWHWKDDRLQSQQQKDEGGDRTTSFQCVYRIKEKKFIRLADDKLKRISVVAKQRWAIATDSKSYDLMASLDGKRYQDVTVIDMQTGERKPALTKARWYYGPSSDGRHFLYYEDGNFWTYEMATGQKRNITQGGPGTFIDKEDDHNVDRPPTRPMGWSRDGQFVLLSDGWDIWQVPAQGGAMVNKTYNGKKDGIRYQSLHNFDLDEPGYDLAKPLLVSIYGEWTKKAGFARIIPSEIQPQVLTFVDALFGFVLKAKNADTYFYTIERYNEFPDYYVSNDSFGGAKRLTNANPQQSQYAWCSGVRLLDYNSVRGEKLQAALYLPANYQPGKKYPTVVYIYEKLSQGLNRYLTPGMNGFSASIYTSNGYAVLLPDIRYEINDPGKSSVGCVLPALDAAIKSGVVDQGRVGLQGHSWGGYQTAFLVTQTDAFKAAVAGAPLTNLVSMYSSIYWNVGMANQPIFESSQGRFTSGYCDNLECYLRNSPVIHAKNVKTPLMILHNDKDGAVDFNQGIEYFNTLRRLQKPVIMLQYKGENHGLAKNANRKDYSIRMKEFFDHYLMDKPAPDWLKEGVPHLKMDEHLKGRGKE
jgi:acetyl esterase/lipase